MVEITVDELRFELSELFDQWITRSYTDFGRPAASLIKTADADQLNHSTLVEVHLTNQITIR
jgi:hypothetical protein